MENMPLVAVAFFASLFSALLAGAKGRGPLFWLAIAFVPAAAVDLLVPLAGWVNYVVGFGLPLVALVVVLLMPPAQTAK